MRIKLFPPQAIHEIGQRDNQEDAIYPLKGKAKADDKLFLVCDGMGGHAKGEVASRTVAATIATFIKKNLDPASQALTDELLMGAIKEAYNALDERDDGSFKKMGTTLALVSFHKGGATVAHIGDSRIYHMRPSTGEILYKSRDHSLVYELYQAGELSYKEMKTSPQKNVITRAMMPGEDNRTRADIVHITDIKPGDDFYHCSDGMLEEMEDEDIMAILSSNDSDQLKASKLVEATTGSKDNHSAYLLHVADVEAEPGDDKLDSNEAIAMCNAINVEKRMGKADLDIMDVDEEDEDTQQVPPKFDDKKDKADGTPPAITPELAAAAATAAAEAKAATPPPAPVTPPAPTPAPPAPKAEITKPIGMGAPAGFDPNKMPPAPERPKRSKAPLIILLLLLLLGGLGAAGWYFQDEIKDMFGYGKAKTEKQESSASQSSASESSASDSVEPIDPNLIEPDDEDDAPASARREGNNSDVQRDVQDAINRQRNDPTTTDRRTVSSSSSNGYNTRNTQQLNQSDVQNQNRGAADNAAAARRQIQNMQPTQVITVPANGNGNQSTNNGGSGGSSYRNIRNQGNHN